MAVRLAQNLSIMHDPTAQYSKMSLEHVEEGNASSCTTDLCNGKPIPPSTHNSATRPLCNRLCQNLRRASICFYDRIVLLSLPRHYLYRIRFVQDATGPQPRGQSGLIVRDEAATHAMERLCIQAWILDVCAQVFAAYGWWKCDHIARKAPVALVQYIGVITAAICVISLCNGLSFALGLCPSLPSGLHKLVALASAPRLGVLARELATLPASLIWVILSVGTTLSFSLSSVQSRLPPYMHHPASSSIITVLLFILGVCFICLAVGQLNTRIAFVLSLPETQEDPTLVTLPPSAERRQNDAEDHSQTTKYQCATKIAAT